MRTLRAGRRSALVVAIGASLAFPPAPNARSFRVRLTPFVVDSQSERLPCEYVTLGNAKAMDVREIDVDAPRGLHHILLYAYEGDDRDPRYLTHGIREGLGCFSVGPPDLYGDLVGLLGAVRGGPYRMPEGYAVSLRADQPVSVQTHVFNATRSRRIRSAVRLRFVGAKPGTVRHHLSPIDALAITFELPPGETSVFTGDFIAPFDLNVAMVSSHQHQHGTSVVVHPVVGGVEQDPIYENHRWSEPHLRWLDPPVRLRQGDRLRVRCEWLNTTDHPLHYGASANDEMCNLNGYFFRDMEVAPEARTGASGFLVPVVE
jgi:hypothetical protein